MSHFYGEVHGGRGRVNRVGHKSAGLRVVAKSWNHAITVLLSHRDGVDYVQLDVDATRLFNGPLAELASRNTLVLTTPQDQLHTLSEQLPDEVIHHVTPVSV